MKIKSSFLRYLIYVCEIIIFFIIQQSPALSYGSNLLKPMLILSIVLTISIFELETPSVLICFFAGVLLDLGNSGSIGIFSFVMPIIGYLVSLISTHFIKINLITSTIISVVCIVFFYLIDFLINYMFKGYSDLSYTLLNNYLPRMIYTLLLSPIFYFFNKAIFINLIEKSE